MTHEPPTTEQMCEVVAKVEYPALYDVKMKYRYCNKTDCGYFYDADLEDGDEYADPRHDTDAALELLHHILTCRGSMAFSLNSKHGGGWSAMSMDSLPTSGPAFRAAVCNLAVKVLLTKEANL